MTLKQAFTLWALAPSNTVLAARSRDAVQRVLMKKWNDIDLEQFTEAFCRRIFYQSTETLETKVKAASILIYLLQWGGDNGHCKPPKFTYDIASEEHQRAQQDKARPASPEDSPNSTEPQQLTDMEQKKKRGKQPKPVVQIDPNTLQVLKEWPSMTEAHKALGIHHIEVAISRISKAGGFYWSLAADADTFRQRLNDKLQEADMRHKERAAKMREKKTAKETEPTRQCDAAGGALEAFTDDELMTELDRRGWHGKLHRTQVVAIGTE